MTEEDPFAGFETTAEIASYIYAEHGVEALRVLLDMGRNPASYDLVDSDGKPTPPHHAEQLIEVAAEFEGLGLSEAAEVVLKYAAKAPPNPALICPFDPNDPIDPIDRGNFVDWHLNKRPKMKQPFPTEDEAEQCLVNATYGRDDDGLWRRRHGKVEAKVIPSEDGDGFRIAFFKA